MENRSDLLMRNFATKPEYAKMEAKLPVKRLELVDPGAEWAVSALRKTAAEAQILPGKASSTDRKAVRSRRARGA